jgi:multiple sugar transport system ATP-binding protein
MNLDQASIERLHGYHKKALVMGIRPENIHLTNADDAVLSAECFVAEPQGSHQIVAVELDGKLMKLIAPPRPPIKPGDIIHMGFKQEAILFFDKESGLRI